MTYQNDMRSRI